MKRLFKLGILVAVVAGIAKMVSAKKAEWQGLSESEVRAKLHTKLGAKMPTEKVDEIGDKVVDAMRQRGVLGEDVPDEAEAEAEAEAEL